MKKAALFALKFILSFLLTVLTGMFIFSQLNFNQAVNLF
jgi:hypothetical protein